MELLIEVRATHGGPRVPLRVRVDPASTLGELLPAVAAYADRPLGTSGAWLARTGAPLRPGVPVAGSGLRTGDTIVFDAMPPPPPPTGARFELLVIGGPASGRRYPLPPGEYIVGRDRSATVFLDDQEASRRHLHLGAGSHEVVATDLGSTNGTLVDGTPLTGSVSLRPGQIVQVGNTLLTVEAALGDTGAALRERDGWLDFDRPPRVRQSTRDDRLAVPMVPSPVEKKKLPLSASLVPIVIGLVLAYFLGPIMLLFSLMGPVMAIASMIEDKRSGRKDYARRVAEFEAAMESLTPEAATRHAAVIAARRAASPSSAHLARTALAYAASLWPRRLADSDFLALRIGSKDQPSRLVFDQPPNDLPSADLAATSEALRAAHAVDPCVPVDVDLRAVGVLGVAGPAEARESVLRSYTVQIATLTSPRDLAIVVLCPPTDADRWSWTAWLPHTTSLTGADPDARTVASADGDIRQVLQLVDDLITQRRIDAQRKLGFGDDGFAPHVVLVVPGSIPVPRATLSRVFSTGPEFGISVLVGADREEQLPGECRAIVVADAALSSVTAVVTGTGDRIGGITGDGTPLDVAGTVARALAPVRDVTAASASGEVPRTALLPEVLGVDALSADAVGRRWERSARDRALAAPLGIGAAGLVSIDLRRDGPHGLVAGTTGAGKSELLQSFVTALAASHPASRLTFVLVDYKGGAAFADCVGLPHTVGFFTDLDSHLARRALVSLNAELRRREEILREYGAKDIIDMESRFAAHAPANLLIVFDEFAFLKKEVPEFVAGVVDIAQRGRSLGVHLILATQRPSGVVDDHIRANTNLRIALRIADEADSTDVLDRPDAAHIPKTLPGRAYVRTGHADVQVVQAAFGGARSAASGPQRIPLKVTPFAFAPGAVRAGSGGTALSDDDQPTDLQQLVSAIVAADRAAGIPAQPKPWLSPLADSYRLDSLAGLAAPPPMGPTPHSAPPTTGPAGLSAPLGVVDLPSRQAQQVWSVDLDQIGHLIVFGTGGAGKTTVLRTLAASLASRLGPEDLHLYALDFGSRGLSAIAGLPQCGGVVDADERERTERLFVMLDDMIAERKKLLGAVGAASLPEYRAAGNRVPYVVVLFDGYGAFHTAYLNVDHGELVERFARIAAEGRAVGVHLVVTADRRNAIPSTLSGVMPGRLVLRMADPDEYAALAMPMALADAVLPPGRGFVDGDVELQVAYAGPDPSGPGQREGLTALAGTHRAPAGAGPAPVALLPSSIDARSLRPGGPLTPLLGISGTDHGPSYVDMDDLPVFAVFGADRSGRSTALVTLTRGLAIEERYLLTPRRSALRDLPGWTRAAAGLDDCEDLAVDLGDLVRERSRGGGGPFLVVVDDGDELVEGRGSMALETVVKRGRDAGLKLLVAAQTHTAHRTFGGWLTEVRKAKHGLILSPDVDVDGDLLGTRLPRKAGRAFPPGRGYVVRRGAVDIVQVAEGGSP